MILNKTYEQINDWLKATKDNPRIITYEIMITTVRGQQKVFKETLSFNNEKDK